MPIQSIMKGNSPGYRWDDTGAIHTYEPNDPESRRIARQQALQDGKVININKGSVLAANILVPDTQKPPGTSQSEEIGQGGCSDNSEMFDIKKFYDDEQLVFGWASVAKQKDGTRPIEWQGDEIEMHEMEPAVYDFVLQQGITKQMHRVEKAKGQVIESVIFTKQKMAAMGIPEGTVPEGWWIGFKLHDRDTFMKVKNGIYKMFSIEGKGVRIPIGGEE